MEGVRRRSWLIVGGPSIGHPIIFYVLNYPNGVDLYLNIGNFVVYDNSMILWLYLDVYGWYLITCLSFKIISSSIDDFSLNIYFP